MFILFSLGLLPARRSTRAAQRESSLALRRTQPVAILNSDAWADLGLCSPLCATVTKLLGDSSVPSEPQQLAWSHLITGEDTALISEAGSGKTLAYLLPLLQGLLGPLSDDEDALLEILTADTPLPVTSTGVLLVVVPTQDLVQQVLALAAALSAELPLSVGPASAQDDSMHVVVGTVPAAAAWLGSKAWVGRRSTYVADGPGAGRPALRLVVDEADVCLAGVQRKGTSSKLPIMQLLSAHKTQQRRADPDATIGGGVQLVLASATMPGQNKASMGAFVQRRFPHIHWVRSAGAHRPVVGLETEFIQLASSESSSRVAALLSALQEADARTVIFANSASAAEHAAELLRSEGIDCHVFHPQLAPEERAHALETLHSRAHGVLVCSGLAARGIDFVGVELVLQYELAPNVIEYMHRVGRTARGGGSGRAVALVAQTPSEQSVQKEIERCIRGGWKYI
jgi:superfamily II DNA/RNA helicase